MIQAKDLTKEFEGKPALRNLNLLIGQGEIYCLLGQNGAGKTTTINIFLGFTSASKGEALINGLDVKFNRNKTNKLVAYIPEVVQLYSNLTGLENLDFFSRLAGYQYTHSELGDFLRKVGLKSEVHSRRMATYSKGMRQKVGIAIAFAKQAEVIFMDEPTSGLDPKASAEFIAICRQFVAENKSIFMATHDIFNAVNVGSRIGIMREGVLVQEFETHTVDAAQLQQIYLETI